MVDYYFAIIFLTGFIMVIMLLMIPNNEMLDDPVKLRMRLMAVIVIVAAISEWLGVWMNGAPIWSRPIHIAVKIVEFSVAPVISFVCAGMIGRVKNWKLIKGFLIVHALVELLSGFTGFIFYVDEHNVYHHGTCYWIYLGTLLVGMVLFIFVVLNESRHQYGTHKVMMIFLSIFTVCGLAFQYLGEEVRVIWLCTAVDVLIIYILYVELTQNTDALTHLMNRRYYENRIAGLKESALIFYFDVDDFKSVNDTYGHRFGDVSLATIGRTMYAIFNKVGYCYRIGGDEFAAITQIPVHEAEAYCENLMRAMEMQRMREPKLPYVSVGYAYFDPEQNSIADVINAADAMMYERKRASKGARK